MFRSAICIAHSPLSHSLGADEVPRQCHSGHAQGNKGGGSTGLVTSAILPPGRESCMGGVVLYSMSAGAPALPSPAENIQEKRSRRPSACMPSTREGIEMQSTRPIPCATTSSTSSAAAANATGDTCASYPPLINRSIYNSSTP
eukprot:Filipodium_phascolosomae@DN4075_c0_g1_i1.p1